MSSHTGRVKVHHDHAVNEIELMHKAIDEGDYKQAIQHKIIAGIAIDDMVNASEMARKDIHNSED